MHWELNCKNQKFTDDIKVKSECLEAFLTEWNFCSPKNI